MIKRHLVALLITIGIYYAPYIIPTQGDWFWIRASTLSLLYIVLIYHFAKTRISALLISIEFTAMFWNFASCYEYFLSPESQLFNIHYGHIMSYCFVLEVLTIIGGALSGRFKRIYRLWVHPDSRNRNYDSAVFTSENHLCINQ